MGEMRLNLIQLLFVFTVFVVQHSTTESFADMRNVQGLEGVRGTENDPKQLITQLLGKDVGKDVTSKRARHPPSYMRLLYNSMEESAEIEQEQHIDHPKIRSFRGIKGERNHIHFPLANVEWSGVNRSEIVLKITDKIRRLAPGPGLNITLLLYNEGNENVSVDAHLYTNYLIFGLPALMNTRRSSLSIDKYLLVNDDKIKISKINEPLLLLYEHIAHNPLLSEVRRNRRQASHVERLLPQPGEGSNSSCRKMSWYINMAIFNFNWWIEPRAYNAGICSGSCVFPLIREGTNSSSYSFMKNMWLVEMEYANPRIPRACCVPVKYAPLLILYLNSDIEADIMIVADMKVKYCGCR